MVTGREKGRVVLLANPTAGGGTGARIGKQAVHTFAGLGYEATLVFPRAAWEAEEATRAAVWAGDPPKALVSIGGDGTVRLAASIAVDLGLPLGIIPAGTGNGIAYTLGLPLDAWKACQVVARGRTHRCDLGRIEFLKPGGPASSEISEQAVSPPVFFVNAAGTGLDAVVTRAYQEDGLPIRGMSGYVVNALRALATFQPVPLEMVLDGTPVEIEALLVAVGNGSFYGKGIRILPPARPADGILDVCVLMPINIADFSALVPMLLLGRHLAHPRVRVFRAREIILRPRPAQGHSRREVLVQADGDVFGCLPVRVTVVPGGVNLIVDAPPDHAGARAWEP